MQITPIVRGNHTWILGSRNGEEFGRANTFALDVTTGQVNAYGPHAELTVWSPADLAEFKSFLHMARSNPPPTKPVMVDISCLPEARQTAAKPPPQM